ncbi:MAG: peptidyl-prolyl cis-trans isomerase [Candidatus Aenigmatarchaeota archaeon]
MGILIKIFILIFCLMNFYGCVSSSQKEEILAYVNGKPVTTRDLEYPLKIIHRKQYLSHAKKLDLTKLVEDTINDILITNEARSMGMSEMPQVKKAVQEYIITESVRKLYDEEIKKKIYITEEEIKKYYESKKGAEATAEEIEKFKESIIKNLRKQKEKEISDAYLKQLRTKASIEINNEILSSIKIDNPDELKKYSEDKRQLCKVNETVLTVGEFISIIKSYSSGFSNEISKESILNNWIDSKVVDYEALSRNYMNDPDFKNKVIQYEDQILKRAFIENILIPKIKISEESLKEFYLKNKDRYITSPKYKFMQISVKTLEEAQNILKSLENGADFLWLAQKNSNAPIETGWLSKEEMLSDLRELVERLKPGETTPVIKTGSSYAVFKLLEIKEGTLQDFDKIKNNVYNDYYNEQIKNLYNEYANELRKDAKIEIIQNNIDLFEKKLLRGRDE